MKKSSRPRTAVERHARRNYMIFGVASTVGLTALVGAVSVYLTAT